MNADRNKSRQYDIQKITNCIQNNCSRSTDGFIATTNIGKRKAKAYKNDIDKSEKLSTKLKSRTECYPLDKILVRVSDAAAIREVEYKVVGIYVDGYGFVEIVYLGNSIGCFC